MAQTYTNSWGLVNAAPRIIKKGRAYRPAFNETVGQKVEGEHRWRSWFEQDMPYLPSAAPVLERLVAEEKVQPKESGSREYAIRYNVCHQCSCEFPTKAANARFCKDCAAERKRESDRYAWMRRKAKQDAEKGQTEKKFTINDALWDGFIDSSKDEFVGTQMGNLTVLKLVKQRRASSLYLCKCKCGEEFVVYQSVLKAKSLQVCPACMNLIADFPNTIQTKELLDTSYRSKELLVGRMSGFLSVKEMINESLLLCNCGCGRRIVVGVNDFLSHTVTSCGCTKDNDLIRTERKFIHKGERFGYVTCLMATSQYQLEAGRKGRGGSQWLLCQCDCGTQFYVTRTRFDTRSKGKKAFSCGCMKHGSEIVRN